MNFRRLALALMLLCTPLPIAAADLAAHSAVYELNLVKARGDVSGATGTMSYDVVDACDGWTVHQRLAMTITNSDGQDVDVLSEYTTYERKNGESLSFRSRQMTGRTTTSEVVGEAQMTADGGEVKYAIPEGSVKKLSRGTLFPMAHTDAILTAALAGKKFVEVPLFDGTGAEGAQSTSIAISGISSRMPSRWAGLADLPSVRVHVAFFDQDVGAQQPDYEVTIRYWMNGIADDLEMDFGDFIMRGRLTTLTVGASKC